MQHCKQGLKREGGLPLQGSRVGRVDGCKERWTEHLTPVMDDYVCVNVITAFITAYMMIWQKVLTWSALIFAKRKPNALKGLAAHVVQIILL